MNEIKGRVIQAGNASGPVMFSDQSLLIYGGIDPATGIVIEHGHPLKGKCVAGKILVFPEAKGSTVGSYTILQLKRNGVCPLAIINRACEPIVAAGVIIARIPCMDQVDLESIKNANALELDDGVIRVR
nr:DUF126 domain-containing protein [Candidatus Sigynarchaeota archaeon]